MASSYETSVSVSASPRTRGHDPRKCEGLTARIAARTQALRQQTKSYVEDELSSHEIAVRIGRSSDGEPTLRCVGGLVYTYGLAPIRPMIYLIIVPISKFQSRMDGCALHGHPGHLIPHV